MRIYTREHKRMRNVLLHSSGAFRDVGARARTGDDEKYSRAVRQRVNQPRAVDIFLEHRPRNKLLTSEGRWGIAYY